MKRQMGILVALVALGLGLAGSSSAEDEAPAVFHGEVTVEAADVLVSVVDGAANPISGLTREDFTVVHNGTAVPVTFFAEVTPDRRDLAPAQRVILVFDRTSLEKTACRRVVEALEQWLDEGTGNGREFMVVATGGGVDVLQSATSDRGAVKASLERLMGSDFAGDELHSTKTLMTRSIRSAKTIQSGWTKTSEGSSGSSWRTGSGNMDTGHGLEDGLGSMQADTYREQVNGLQQQEAMRIYAGLADLEAVIRGTAGRNGRQDVVWIGEDLVVSPALDVYTAFHEKFQRFRNKADVPEPDMWAARVDLSPQFEAIAGLAMSTGAVVHMVDAQDRDRDQQDRMRQGIGPDRVNLGDNRAFKFYQGSSSGQELRDAGRILAGSTGGIGLMGSRDFAGFLKAIDGLTTSWYWLGYQPPEGLDGNLHPVEVTVRGEGRVVRTADRVPASSAYHRLADRAMGEMMLHQAEDPIGFSVQASDRLEAENGSIVQSFRVVLPTDGIAFKDQDDAKVATLAVAVAQRSSEGAVTPATVFRLPVSVPMDRFRPGSRVASSFRLVVDPGLAEVSVALRDENSGVVGAHSVTIK